MIYCARYNVHSCLGKGQMGNERDNNKGLQVYNSERIRNVYTITVRLTKDDMAKRCMKPMMK